MGIGLSIFIFIIELNLQSIKQYDYYKIYFNCLTQNTQDLKYKLKIYVYDFSLNI